MKMLPYALLAKTSETGRGRRMLLLLAILATGLLLLGRAVIPIAAADDPFAGEDAETDTIAERPKEPLKAGSADPLTAVSPELPTRFFRTRKGVDIPIIDDRGKLIYERPDEKDPSEMTEEDFYKTMTPAEKILLSNRPETAPELIEAAVCISRVGRPEFGRLLAQKALEAEGDPADYAAVIDRLGEDKLIAFVHNPVVGETGRVVAHKTLEEAKKAWRDPVRIQEGFERAGARSPEIRAAALADLKRGYPDSFDFLLQKLESGDEGESARAADLIARGGIFASEGILERCRTCDELRLRLLAPILEASGELPKITPLLVRYYSENLSPESRQTLERVIRAQTGTVPTPAEGAQSAYRRGMAYYEGKIVLPNTVDGEYPLWIENEDGRTVRETVPAETALRELAVRELRDASLLDPENAQIRAAAQVAAAESILYRGGLDAPADTAAFRELYPDLTATDCTAALRFALETQHEKGGIIPAILLGELGDASLCIGDRGPADLVRAAVSRDRRLRFAALKTIVTLAPAVSYPGSSAVTSSLIWFTSSLGKRRAIVAAPDMETINLVGGYVADGGVITTPAGTGRDILTKAQNDADVEFIVARSDVKTPDLRTVAQALAADYRTGDIPMLIVFEDDTRKEQARRYGEGEPNVLVSIIPFDNDSGTRLIGELFDKTDPRQVPADVRFEQAKEALSLLTRLREINGDLYRCEDLEDLAHRYLVTPALTRQGIDFAMTVPDKLIQVTLSLLIFDNRFDADTRRLYLDALREHIGRYGLLLRGPDILKIFSGPWPGDSGEVRKEFFRLLAWNTPEQSEIALSIPSIHIQNLLGDLVGDSSADPSEREECLDLFRRHLEKYGLLLDRPDVQRLYDRYNATENEPELDQYLTSEVLEAIEAWQAGHLGIK